jgi:hypothetical protein
MHWVEQSRARLGKHRMPCFFFGFGYHPIEENEIESAVPTCLTGNLPTFTMN